jgi:hypothetical protein
LAVVNTPELTRDTYATLDGYAWQSGLQQLPPEYREVRINEFSSELAQRFRTVFATWKVLFDRIHNPDTTDPRAAGRLISHDVHLFPLTHAKYGEGMVSALVLADYTREHTPEYRTESYFRNENIVLPPSYEVLEVPGRNHPGIRGWDEDFVSPEPRDFLRPGFEWTSLPHKDIGTAWSNLANFGHVSAKILNHAEETHTYLSQAIGDTVLNPHLAQAE